MDKLLAYLNSLTPEARDAFALRCQTTAAYLRKACSVGQRLGYGLCLRISIESFGALSPEDLRSDVDWEYLRSALKRTPAVVSIAPVAPEPAALAVTTPAGALRAGVIRRHATRRAKDLPIDSGRRHTGPPFHLNLTGVA